MRPYYERGGISIYLGDCREVLPTLDAGSVDLVLTDPPYPDFNTEHGKSWDIPDIHQWMPLLPPIRQFVFWPVLRDFPLDFTSVHVWHKPNGQSNEHYERVFERHGQKVCRVWRIPIINYRTLPEWTPHPCQKPVDLLVTMLELCPKSRVILDPFLGSGTTLVAAKMLGRRAIGIEIEERYAEIAARRLDQEVLPLPTTPTASHVQAALREEG